MKGNSGSFRKERVGDLVHSTLASHLREMLDERLQSITVTEVVMSSDLKIAKVYVSDLWDNEKGAIEALIHAKNLLKRKVAEELKLRYVPDLHFYYDASVKKVNHIETLLNSIRKE
jgi:ribosome-binding factor A